MKLIRGYLPGVGAFGEVFSKDNRHLSYSVERDWCNNLPFVSCVPEGEYSLKPFFYKGEIATFALENLSLDVSVSRINDSDVRYACCLHAANWPYQLQGCVAPVMSLKPLYSKKLKQYLMAGSNSSAALSNVLQYLKESGDRKLIITHKKGVLA